MSMKSCWVLVLAVLATCARDAIAQEEIGKRRTEKIVIEWAQLQTTSYEVHYESIIPVGTVKQVVDGLEEALGQYVAVFKHKPEEKFKVKFLDSLNTYEQEGGDPSHPGSTTRDRASSCSGSSPSTT